MSDSTYMPNYGSWVEYFQGDSLFKNAIRLQTLLRIILKYVGPSSKLIEAGAGSGSTGVLLSDMGYDVTLLDIERGLLDMLQARFPGHVRFGKIKAVHGDMYSMPFSDQAFDLVYHQGVLEHLTDAQIVCALKQQARIGRIVVVDVPNNRYPDRPYGDERRLSKRTWLRLIQKAGLQVLEVSGRRFPRWMYLLPHGVFLHPLIDRLDLGKWGGVVSIFVCQSPLRT